MQQPKRRIIKFSFDTQRGASIGSFIALDWMFKEFYIHINIVFLSITIGWFNN